MQFVYDHLDRGDYVLGIFFDLSRAFDSLLPQYLKEKLYASGVRGPILDWLISFVTGRGMRVAMSGAVSGVSGVDLGVAQGSLIGPILFLLFINDLPEFMTDIHVVMYVDDTSIAVAASDADAVSLKVRQVVGMFNEWCKRNRIMLNMEKTVYVNFHARRPVQPAVMVNCALSRETCFLGIHIDENLNFGKHIEHVCGTLNRSYFAMLKLKGSLEHRCMIDAYYALCHSRITYGCLLWGRARD